ncbi:MAG: sulfite exporter TauE/SafE family protein [Candidatus Bathyarchaeota archaeon]|nr:sulfite exporter TauE/SafE family protein [Candidatus Bathyarchaeota archaeon]
MSFIPELANPYLSVFVFGFIYGISACTASCLPYIASYIAGIGAGFKKGVQVTLIFNSGRLVSYALIGALVGAVSGLIKYFTDAAISESAAFSVYSSIFFGIVTIIIGAQILIKTRRGSHDCGIKDAVALSDSKGLRGRFDVKAFTLGLTRGLIICPPLILILGYSATFTAPLSSLTMAVLFGLGTAISPFIILAGGLTGWLLNKAPLFRRYISIAGALLLIVLGVGTIINTLTVIM